MPCATSFHFILLLSLEYKLTFTPTKINMVHCLRKSNIDNNMSIIFKEAYMSVTPFHMCSYLSDKHCILYYALNKYNKFTDTNNRYDINP